MFNHTRKRGYYKKQSKLTNKISLSLIMLLLFAGIIGVEIRFFHIATTKEIEGIPIKEFSNSLNTQTRKLISNRGKIYGSNNELLAYDVNTYSIIAYLNEARTGDSKITYHVEDIDKTAEQLAPILKTSKEKVLSYLNKEVFQTYLGYIGSNITEKQRQEILSLNLPGIEFIKTTDRIYPFRTFASYEIGYSKFDSETNKNNGELGIEQFYNELLNGVDGSITYVSDKYGYKIPGTNERVTLPEQGKDIYLTIDKEIQLIVESILNKHIKYFNAELLNVVIADVETGKIVASSSRPSFDPNRRDMELYMNPLVSLAFEPGSTMKIYTYAAAMQEGLYNGNDTFMSGSYEIVNDTVTDWNRRGWGEISYDTGFKYSSNVGVTNLVLNGIGGRKLGEYLYRFGFGNKVGLGLPMEENGNLTFMYDIEVANAAFGQGITTTPIQHIQSLLIIANDGVMKKPYLVEKIVDPETGEIILENKTEIIDEQVVSPAVAAQIRELMDDTVNDEDGTGRGYKVNETLIGKTGTAQIAQGDSYSDDSENYIYSFAGMFPKESPKFVIYAYLKKPIESKNELLKNIVRDIVSNINMLFGLERNTVEGEVKKYSINNYISSKVSSAKSSLQSKGNNVIILGDGEVVIDQYPVVNTQISNNDLIVLKTYSEEYRFPNLVGMSRMDAEIILKMLSLDYSFEGNGYVYAQSIETGNVIYANDKVTIKLETEE